MHSVKINLARLVGLSSFIFVISLIPNLAEAQRGLQLEDDTLSKTVLIHPVIQIGENQ